MFDKIADLISKSQVKIEAEKSILLPSVLYNVTLIGLAE